MPKADRPGVFWATAWFFCLLFGYYHLRPLREAKGFASGSDEIPWLFLGSFLVMLLAVPVYGWVVNQGRGVKLVWRVYGFFVLNLIGFFFAMQWTDPVWSAWVGRVYFVWLSVFNLFVVSLMWSVFADAYHDGQAKKYFGWISAGGTLGGFLGSEVARYASTHFNVSFVAVVAGVLLIACGYCAGRFISVVAPKPLQQPDLRLGSSATGSESIDGESDDKRKASIFAGVAVVFRSPYLLGVFLFLLAIKACATTVYCEQGDFIRSASLDEQARFALLANINTWVLGLTLVLQLFGTAPLVRWLGLPTVLVVFPAIYLIGFGGLAFAPSLPLVITLVVAHRAASYAVIGPAVQMLYTVIEKETLYKAKSFLDTAVVRGGDVLSAQVFGLLRTAGQSLSAIAILFIPVALITCLLGGWIGSKQRQIVRSGQDDSLGL